MSRRRHHNTPTPATPLPPDRDALPPWLPVGSGWNDLPEAVRQAVPRILVPAYRQFVLDAPDELQRSIGLTLVHLLWIEMCGQMQMVDVVADPTSLAATLNRPEEMIDRHLTIVAAKSQTTELLVKLRLFSEALARSVTPGLPSLPPPLLSRAAPVCELEKTAAVDQQTATSSTPTSWASAAGTSELEKPSDVDQQINRSLAELHALRQQAIRDFPDPSDSPNLSQNPTLTTNH